MNNRDDSLDEILKNAFENYEKDKSKDRDFTDYYNKAFNEKNNNDGLKSEFIHGIHEEVNLNMKNYNKNSYDFNYNKGYTDGYSNLPYDDMSGNQRNGYKDGYTDGFNNFQYDNGLDVPPTNQNAQPANNGYAQNAGNNSQNRQVANRNNQASPSNRKSKNKSQDKNLYQNDYQQSGKPKKAKQKKVKLDKNGKKKKKFSLKKFIIIIVLIIVLLFGLISALLLHYIGKMDLVETGNRVDNSASVISSSDVKNILVIGTDERTADSGARSDSMILISINKKTKKFVQTSFMRDIYCEIPGNNSNKLNAAYQYGGAELLMDTIEQNFDIEIDKYVKFDFYSFIDIIDSLGGLDIKVTVNEAEAMKDPINEQNFYNKKSVGTDYIKITKTTTVHMNGNQALAFARIRKIPGSTGTDFSRTDRQRIVLNMIMDKMKVVGPFKLNDMLNSALPDITTNMSKSELYFLALRAVFILNYDREQMRMPYGDEGSQSADRFWEYSTTSDGQSILSLDFAKNKQLLKKVIYDGRTVAEAIQEIG